jgi:hypothetical protein
MLKVKITNVIKPKSHFIESIEIDGGTVTVKMKNRKTLYHYQPSKEVIALIKKADTESYGHLYNTYLKGHSISKTVFEDEAEAATA